MASLYRLDRSSAQVALAFSADVGPDPWAGGALVPGSFAPVIMRAGKTGQRVIRPMHWGYPPPGQSSEAYGTAPPRWAAQVRNIESPFWIGNLRHVGLRCLIPATGFAIHRGGMEHWYGVKDRPIFAMAAIWRDLTDMPVFAVLTTEPSSALLPVEGGRRPSAMPVLLAPQDEERWLNADWKEAQALVAPYPGHLLHAFEDE